MKTSFLVLFALLPAPSMAVIAVNDARISAQTEGAWEDMKLTWTAPEDNASDNGSPIGNGHIGAKIKGGIGSDLLQLNDKWFWSGGPHRFANDASRQAAVAETRRLLAIGDHPGAEDAAKGMWVSNILGTFLPLGNLTLDFAHGNIATNYQRTLDLDRALSTVSYVIDGVTYTRETFASHADDVIVMRISASAPGKISFTARLSYPAEMEGHGASVAVEGADTIVMKGKAPSNSGWDVQQGMTSEGRLKVAAQGGSVAPAPGGGVAVSNADSAVLIFANAVSYNGFDKEPGTQGKDPHPIAAATLAAASAKSYDQLLAAHLGDYRSLFRRVWTEINGQKPNLYAQGFEYARYEMISVSREGDRPNNQQGMWNASWTPGSYSAHWLNENVEKYYSLIETANIGECGESLWNWMKELATTGAATAQIDWGFHGWCTAQSSDIWASTTMTSGNNEWAVWPMGGVWLCKNLYDHYDFGRDKTFLRNTAYPIMKGACEFCLDYLVVNADGKLVTSPSTSPENRYGLVDGGAAYALSEGSTMDMALIRELFRDTINAEKTLDIDADFRAKLEETIPKLLPFQIGANGELQEWSKDYSRLPDDPRNRFTPHRHASHIVSVWPLSQITERGTPDLFAAAKLALINRAAGGYHPDKGAMFARLMDGDRALASNDSFPTGAGRLTGKYPPKYAGFPELLVQSHTDAIELLPALPTSWTSGKAIGLRARGDYELSIEWANGKLVRCQIDSLLGTTPIVRYEGAVVDLATDPRVKLNLIQVPNAIRADVWLKAQTNKSEIRQAALSR